MRTLRITAVLALVLFLAPRAAVAPDAQAAGTLRLYVARHGETDWTLAHRLQGVVLGITQSLMPMASIVSLSREGLTFYATASADSIAAP